MPRAALMLILAAAWGCGSGTDQGGQDGGRRRPDASTSADAGDAGDPCAAPGVQTLVELVAEPSAVQLDVGEQARIAVTGRFASGCVRNVTGTVFFTVDDPSVGKIVVAPSDPGTQVPGRALLGLKAGAAQVRASTTETAAAGIVSNPIALTVKDPVVVQPDAETRGVFVTRYLLDGLTATQGAAALRAVINQAADANFNAVFFQVRGVGDAYYRSSLVPWWQDAGRQLGADPGWDPLQVAIDAAHARGIELHAWLNALSGWNRGSAVPASATGAPAHILRQHPEYVCKDGSGVDSATEYTWIAAEEGYRAHFEAVVGELLSNYAVDGVHLDRVRTPGPGFCHTPALDALRLQLGVTHAELQRLQIDALVQQVYRISLTTRPQAVVSASVWGIYQALPGCTTSQGYVDYHQDSIGWMQRGLLDAVVPMIYWDVSPGSCTDFGALLDRFTAGKADRMVFAGMEATDDNGASTFPPIVARIEYARGSGAVGNVVFASALLDDAGLWDDYKSGPYATPAVPSPMGHR